MLIYLLRNGLDVDGVETLVNHGCGLKGLTGHSDIREVSGVALDVFYRSVAKAIAGFASVLGGLDCVVFTGGIGQHSAEARAAILGRLEFLSFAVKAMPSEEELQIARECRTLMGQARSFSPS